mmetsp:Transcript_14359/g.34729  ORF Transcript_14359/g.34729 Transcript_14359/m.34729 type:complete len:82 (+) Transcript_14359:3282-3527(+)
MQHGTMLRRIRNLLHRHGLTIRRRLNECVKLRTASAIDCIDFFFSPLKTSLCIVFSKDSIQNMLRLSYCDENGKETMEKIE